MDKMQNIKKILGRLIKNPSNIDCFAEEILPGCRKRLSCVVKREMVLIDYLCPFPFVVDLDGCSDVDRVFDLETRAACEPIFFADEGVHQIALFNEFSVALVIALRDLEF